MFATEMGVLSLDLVVLCCFVFFFSFFAMLGLGCRVGFSLVAVHGLLTAVASLVAEHRL